LNDKKPILGLPEIKLGVIPGAGGTVRLPKLIGLQQALGIILAGGSVSPKKAKQLGLVDELIETEDRYGGEHRFLANVRRAAVLRIDKGVTYEDFAFLTFSQKERIQTIFTKRCCT
jgi:3-hydroxyacyl-CoA dehydrogenase